IHDSLGHSLTTLYVQLALADRYHHEGIDEVSRHKLQQAIATSQQLAAQCLTEARQSLRTIHEANFDLEAALLTLSEQMHSSLAVNLNVKLNVKASPLPQQLSYQLYLICKEGLANVQKHANATKAMLSVVHTKDKIVLTIEDNGSGFEVGKVTTGYGLQGMKERSQLLGGQLTVDSAPGQGTQLQLTVPLQQTLNRAQSTS
ncbi:MAG: sensor histidine kinase, partial [Cyanobacteria bacterium J06553_1]